MSGVKGFFFTKWWSLSVKGLLSTGPTPSSFYIFTPFNYMHNFFLFKFFFFLSKVLKVCKYEKAKGRKGKKSLKKAFPPQRLVPPHEIARRLYLLVLVKVIILLYSFSLSFHLQSDKGFCWYFMQEAIKGFVSCQLDDWELLAGWWQRN